VASGEPREPAQSESGEASASPEESGDLGERHAGASEIGNVSFPVSVRGYDRGAVDAYVSRVEHLVAELEATRSPEAVVKQALEQVGERTKRVLEEAGATAEQITVAARQEAEDSTARAKQEAESVVAAAKAEAAEIAARSEADAEATVAQARKEAAEHLESTRAEAAAVREEAEARLRELQADTETIRHERSHLLDDLHELATRVEDAAGAADGRFPPPESPDQAEEETLQGEVADEEAAAAETATDQPTAEAPTRQRSSA
jgi:DivIVA domain-containing protein